MENGQLPDDKLFRAVHDRLSDYEAPYNGADWDAMSRSLDSLPKTARFQWRISLNSILVILGVTGLSVLSYAVATHSSHSNLKSTPQVSAPITTTQTQDNSVAQNTSLPANNNNTASFFGTHQEPNIVNVSDKTQDVNTSDPSQMQNDALTNSIARQDTKTKTKKHNNNDLFFGDQIDRRKGFIHKTQEDQSTLSSVPAISNPNVFYDLDNDGHVKKIILKDSSASKKTKMFTADSTANANPSFAPTNGDGSGFGGNDPQLRNKKF